MAHTAHLGPILQPHLWRCAASHTLTQFHSCISSSSPYSSPHQRLQKGSFSLQAPTFSPEICWASFPHPPSMSRIITFSQQLACIPKAKSQPPLFQFLSLFDFLFLYDLSHFPITLLYIFICFLFCALLSVLCPALHPAHLMKLS